MNRQKIGLLDALHKTVIKVGHFLKILETILTTITLSQQILQQSLHQPDIKSKLIETIPIGSRVKVLGKFDNWYKIQIPNSTKNSYGYCPYVHLIKIKQNLNWKLLKLIMKQMIGTPYLWGGRTNFGIDCSGLLQMLFNFAGISIPRDTHQQVKFFKNSKLFNLINIDKNFDYHNDITMGDIIFWKGHVGIMFSQKFLLHSNAFHMGVFIEPLKIQ